MMKAAIFTSYGAPRDVLQVKNVPIPEPTGNQVRVKVHCASVNAADWHLIRAEPWLARLATGLFRPTAFQIPGADVAGVIDKVGNSAKKFKIGDEVLGDLSGNAFGAFAEYVCVCEDALVLKPANVTMEQAAAIPMASMTALKGLLEIGKLKEQDRLLVLGGSGGVGTFAIQIAKALKTKEVTAVCHGDKAEICRSIGADIVVDYTKTDIATGSEKYDLIVDFAGYRPAHIYAKILSPNGRYVFGGGGTSEMFAVMFKGRWMGSKTQSFQNYLSTANQKALCTITEMLREGKIKPVVKDRFPLDKVAEAISVLEERKAQGKVIINISE